MHAPTTLMLLLPALMLACGNKPSPSDSADSDAGVTPQAAPFAAHHSCEWKAASTCTDFASSQESELEQHRKLCDGFEGTFATGPCPTARLVGTCEIQKDERKRYYQGDSANPFTPQSAKENCEQAPVSGTFTLAQ